MGSSTGLMGVLLAVGMVIPAVLAAPIHGILDLPASGPGLPGVDEVRDLVLGPPTYEVLEEKANTDGSKWTVVAQRDPGPLREEYEQMAQVLIDDAVDAYSLMVDRNLAPCSQGPNPHPDNWGFEVHDTDCTMRIVLTDSSHILNPALAAFPRYEVEIHFNIHATAFVRTQGWFLDPEEHTDEAILRNIFGHEFFHHFQQVVAGAWMPPMIVEGQARAVETLWTPAIVAHDSSPWYSNMHSQADPVHTLQNGINAWAKQPDLPLCERSYDAGLIWGYIYREYGGIGVFDEIWGDDVHHHTDRCDHELYGELDRVIQEASDGSHGVADMLIDLGVEAELGGISWGPPDGTAPRDWTEHMPAITRQTLVTDLVEGVVPRPTMSGIPVNPNTVMESTPRHVSPENGTRFWAGSGGIQYVELPAGIALEVKLDSADADWRHVAIVRDATGEATLEPIPANGEATLASPQDGDVVLVSARTAPDDGWFGVRVMPAV